MHLEAPQQRVCKDAAGLSQVPLYQVQEFVERRVGDMLRALRTWDGAGEGWARAVSGLRAHALGGGGMRGPTRW
jgi:hypothetical protein